MRRRVAAAAIAVIAVTMVIAVIAVAAGATAATTDRWFSFSAYPGAQELCSEHVSGKGMHISWRSFATADELSTAVAFYEKDQGRKATVGSDGSASIHAAARADDIVTLAAADRRQRLPHCGAELPGGTKTVIVVSSAVRQ